MRVSNRIRERRRERNRSMWKTIGIVLAVLFLAVGIYVSNYHHADTEAVEAFLPESTAEKRVLDDGSIAYVPEGATTGVIFYPGAKVEYTAYEPLMKALAERGILAVIIKMPHNLSFLKVNAADGIYEQFSEIESWYISGHSLGGTMAATYASSHHLDVDGVILLASYSTANLSGSDFRVATIYGTLDGVLNKDNYDKYLANLPSGYEETVIEGANHSGFGMYGEQNKDNEATMTNEEQINKTADIIADFLK